MMKKDELIFAIGEISDEYIEKSEQETVTSFKKKTSLILAAVFIFLLSVTAVAVAGFYNTVNGGKMVHLETVGGYTGDVFGITFDIDVAEDAGYELSEYYVPMYLEENWVDCGGEASEALSILVYDNYDENLFAIFSQKPARWSTGKAGFVYSMPVGTKFEETFFEIDGEKIYCIEVQPGHDEYTADPFGCRILFWSDGYNFFSLETRLNMDDEILREIVRSVQKVDNISDYIYYKPAWTE